MDLKEEDVNIGRVHKKRIVYMQQCEIYSPDLQGSVSCPWEDDHKHWGVVTNYCFLNQLNNLYQNEYAPWISFHRNVYCCTKFTTKQGMHPTVQAAVVLGSKPFANLHYEGLDETLQLT
jgi:hypothetical protein